MQSLPKDAIRGFRYSTSLEDAVQRVDVAGALKGSVMLNIGVKMVGRNLACVILAVLMVGSQQSYGQLGTPKRLHRSTRTAVAKSKKSALRADRAANRAAFAEAEELPPEISTDSEPAPLMDSADGVFIQGPGEVIESESGIMAGCSSCNQANCSGGCGGNFYQYKGLLSHGLGIDHLSVFGGVQGFKNQSNRGEGASFGFREGINFGTFGRGIILPPTWGAQVGFSASQTDLEGADFSETDRNQTFFTAGIYRRCDAGLQGGIVFDLLNDDWYYDDLSVSQLRGEVSMAISNRRSYGFQFASSLEDDTQTSNLLTGAVIETWETVEHYSFFYRTQMVSGGSGEVKFYAGWTGDSDGLIGADSKLPLHNGWALESNFTYLIPNDQDTTDVAFRNEAWNLGINLVWYPGSLNRCGGPRYHRPLFDVANNGSLILKR